jgi:hypothetical protein
MDENKVVNNEVKETPPAETTPLKTTEKSTTDKGGAVEKQKPVETSDSVPYARFQEKAHEAKALKDELAAYKQKETEKKLQEMQKPSEAPQDPYAGMSLEEREQTRKFIDTFVKPEVRKEYEPFIQQYQTEQLNKQINDASQFASKYGINLEEKMPEIVDYLSRPENRGRLNATEAVRNLYFDQITGAVKTKTEAEVQQKKDELMEKKKQANMQTSTVSPGSVVQSDELARRKIPKDKRLSQDIKDAIELARKGERSPKVHSRAGDGLYDY